MDEKALKEVKELCEPLNKLAPLVKSVFIYGSFLKKDKLDEGSDVDIFIVVDDSRPNYNDEFMKKLVFYLKLIEAKGAKKKIKLHFQPPKQISFLLDLVRNGEPWVITAFRTLYPLVDDGDFASNLSQLINKEKMFSSRYKTEKLMETAYEKFEQAKRILLDEIPMELFLIVFESAQGILSYYGRYPVSPKATLKDLKEIFKSHPKRKVFIDNFEDLYELNDKISRNVLVEFTGDDLDRNYKKVAEFILETEGLMSELENEKKIKNIDNLFNNCKEICIHALKKEQKEIPENETDLLVSFKKVFIDSGKLEDYHYKKIKEIFEYHKRSKNEQNREVNHVSFNKSYLQNLEMAISDVQK